jgi:hypothetical protein
MCHQGFVDKASRDRSPISVKTETPYMKPCYILTLVVFSLNLSWWNTAAKAQEKKYTYTIGGNRFKGLIVKHRKGFGHLSQSFPSGFEAFINRNTYGHKLWEQLYNYPDVGASLGYYDYHNPLIGKSIAANIYVDFYLLRRKKSDLTFKSGTGLVYTSNPHDEKENPRNTAISTAISLTIQGSFAYHYALSSQTRLYTAFTLTHFSNGAIKKPNTGINILTTNMGFSHRLQDKKPSYQRSSDPPPLNEGIKFNLQLASGWQGIDIRPDTFFPFLNLSVYADYRLSHISALSIGLDGFYSTATRERMMYELESTKLPDFKRAGITAGHELFIHKTSVLVQLGAYIYAPYKAERANYQRYGLKYYFHEKVYGLASFKAHLGRAENLEFALGIRI